MSAGTSRQRRARALSGQLDEAPGGELVLPRAQLLDMLPPPTLNGDREIERSGRPERYAQSLLTQHGVRVFPSLSAASSDAVRLVQTPVYAVQGAVAIAVLATLAGLAKYWAYGLIFALAGGAAVALVGVGFVDVRRRVPWLPSGRLLGAAVASTLIVIAAVVLALPIRRSRADDGGAGRAKTLVAEADREINAGHLEAAQRLLTQAQQANAHPILIDDVRGHLVAARFQAQLAERDRREGIYSQAERAFAAGAYRRAIRLGRSVRGFRDIDRRLRAYRAAQRAQRVGR